MGTNNYIFLGIFIGIIAYGLLYLGKVIQKYAIESFKLEKAFNKKHSGIWIGGTILTIIFLIIHWVALLLAPVNAIAPLEGIGLISFLLFSRILLKEKIIKIEILGIIFIIIGTIFITLFYPSESSILEGDYNLPYFIVIASIVFGVEIISIIILILKKNKFAGLLLSITAGTFMAFETVTKRITAIPNASLMIIFIILTIILAFFALLFTQFAFTKADANIVIPCFTSASISIAVVVSFITLSEKILYIQIIGIGLIICGVVFLTAFKK
jgi:uncharacterized membrane protein